MGRMRTLKPNYNRSLDIVPLTVICRYHFALLWTYADDDGRGLDVPALIRSELWPLDGDLIDDSQVEEWQDELEEHGRIMRYQMEGRPYFQITDFTLHQKPQRPQQSLIPPPLDDARTHTRTVRASDCMGTRNVLPVVVEVDVEVEGEVAVEGDARASADVLPFLRQPSLDEIFFEFWVAYPRKVDKKKARAAYERSIKKAPPGQILDALHPWVRYWSSNDPQFTPHPTTWLNGERWNDEAPKPQVGKAHRVDDNNVSVAKRILGKPRTDIG